jgi:uncharacterized membrane protein
VEKEPPKKAEAVAMGLATGWVLLRHRPYRRNLLFMSTLLTLILVFVGATVLGPFLATKPIGFVLFWIGVFLMASFVLLLAIYDLVRIRQDHKRRMDELENELAEAAEEARRLAEEAKRENFGE